jgi:hypothetical protein
MRRLVVLIAAHVLAACAQAKPPAGGPGGPFQLTDHNGRAVDESLLQGR